MSKYGFDLEMCNTLSYANDMLCRIVDDFNVNKIDYDTFLKKRLSVYIHLKNQLQNEIFKDKEVIRKRGEEKMSDIIEERLQKEYKFSKITVVKWHLQPRSYEILIHLDFNSGFSFVFNWKDNFTIDKNIEEIINIIDNLIVRNFKKVRA